MTTFNCKPPTAARFRYPLLSCAVLLAFMLLAPACGGSPPASDAEAFVAPTPDTPPEEAIQTFLTQGHLPAVLVGVIDGGQLLYSRVAGVRKRGDATPVTDDDVFRIGSNTKAMTALLAGTVVDAGQLTWDSTVGDVLSGTVEVGDAYRDVTLTQLLSHSSGMPELPYDEEASFSGSTQPAVADRRKIAELALALPPRSEPGKYFYYSNINYVVAGLMLEVASGESWEALLQERIFTPLAMTNAGFGTPGTPGTVDAPWGHDPSPIDPGSLTGAIPEGFGPAGTVHANLADLVSYAHLYLDDGADTQGNRLISEASLSEMETPKLHHYGFGWFDIDDANGQLVMWHNGSNGTFYSTLVLFPARRGAILLATNAGDAHSWTRLAELDGYLAAHFGLPLERPQ
jgi:CubicO group peptidase (beta-lactamase class C family)